MQRLGLKVNKGQCRHRNTSVGMNILITLKNTTIKDITINMENRSMTNTAAKKRNPGFPI